MDQPLLGNPFGIYTITTTIYLGIRNTDTQTIRAWNVISLFVITVHLGKPKTIILTQLPNNTYLQICTLQPSFCEETILVKWVTIDL